MKLHKFGWITILSFIIWMFHPLTWMKMAPTYCSKDHTCTNFNNWKKKSLVGSLWQSWHVCNPFHPSAKSKCWILKQFWHLNLNHGGIIDYWVAAKGWVVAKCRRRLSCCRALWKPYIHLIAIYIVGRPICEQFKATKLART